MYTRSKVLGKSRSGPAVEAAAAGRIAAAPRGAAFLGPLSPIQEVAIVPETGDLSSFSKRRIGEAAFRTALSPIPKKKRPSP